MYVRNATALRAIPQVLYKAPLSVAMPRQAREEPKFPRAKLRIYITGALGLSTVSAVKTLDIIVKALDACSSKSDLQTLDEIVYPVEVDCHRGDFYTFCRHTNEEEELENFSCIINHILKTITDLNPGTQSRNYSMIGSLLARGGTPEEVRSDAEDIYQLLSVCEAETTGEVLHHMSRN